MSSDKQFKRWKEDSRPARNLWAPGKYVQTCPKCGDSYMGDKRAEECADCAYKMSDVYGIYGTIGADKGKMLAYMRFDGCEPLCINKEDYDAWGVSAVWKDLYDWREEEGRTLSDLRMERVDNILRIVASEDTSHLPLTEQNISMPNVQPPKEPVVVATRNMLYQMEVMAEELAKGSLYKMGEIYEYIHSIWLLGVPLESLKECMEKSITAAARLDVDLRTAVMPFIALYRKV